MALALGVSKVLEMAKDTSSFCLIAIGKVFLQLICEEKFWEYNQKPFWETNWKDFTKQLNAHFWGVDPSWKQVHDDWNKIKDKYEIKKKKIQVISASPSN